jgi:CRISPR associated protein Cas1
MHADLRARDSLACDLMETIRPQADEFVLELIRNREFRKKDFFETREGICRILPPLTHEIAHSASKWKKLISPVAEEIAQRLFKGASKFSNRTFSNHTQQLVLPIAKNILPTPLTGSNRSEGRPFISQPLQFDKKPKTRKPRKIVSWKLDCVGCGMQIDGKHRMYCNSCLGR